MAETGEAHPGSNIPADDAVITFRTDKSAISGRLVRAGSTADTILSRHGNPEAVSIELGEALGLAALLGSALPGAGRINLQTRTDGAVTFLVADYDAPGNLRGYTRFDRAKVNKLTQGAGSRAGLLGQGHMAITIEQAGSEDRYQGIVALDGGRLAEGAKSYFENSEAMPTFVRLAVARHYEAAQAAAGSQWHWRAGGIMLQHVDGADGDEDWRRVQMLAETVEDHELLDPMLTPERLLLRLFHEEGVRIQKVQPLRAVCRCSRARLFDVLRSFGAAELAGMQDANGHISATCEFCVTRYVFEPSEFETAEQGPG
jgi:molecular chaperone Hsp33